MLAWLSGNGQEGEQLGLNAPIVAGCCVNTPYGASLADETGLSTLNVEDMVSGGALHPRLVLHLNAQRIASPITDALYFNWANQTGSLNHDLVVGSNFNGRLNSLNWMPRRYLPLPTAPLAIRQRPVREAAKAAGVAANPSGLEFRLFR